MSSFNKSEDSHFIFIAVSSNVFDVLKYQLNLSKLNSKRGLLPHHDMIIIVHKKTNMNKFLIIKFFVCFIILYKHITKWKNKSYRNPNNKWFCVYCCVICIFWLYTCNQITDHQSTKHKISWHYECLYYFIYIAW